MGPSRDPETPTFAGPGTRTIGEGDDGPGTRRMFDKRTLRKMYRGPFQAAIAEFRAQDAAGLHKHKTPALPPGGTAVYVRKRPIFPRESDADEFDILSAIENGSVLHDCKLRADLKHPYIIHRTFPIKCFNDTQSNDEVCDGINLTRLIQRAVDGEHVTCCMFGQTGSGKSHTMSGILDQAARILFGGTTVQRPPHFAAQLSCFEVCGSNLFDLLEGGEKLVVRENAALKVEVSAKQVDVKSSDQFGKQLQSATANRATSSTLRNMDSSRSHAFYRLTLYSSAQLPATVPVATPSKASTPGVGARSPASGRPPVSRSSSGVQRSSSSRGPASPTPGVRRTSSSSNGSGTPTARATPAGGAASRPRPTISIPRTSSATGGGDTPGSAAGLRRAVSSPGSRATGNASAARAAASSAARTGRAARAASSSSGAASPVAAAGPARRTSSIASRPPFDSSPVSRAAEQRGVTASRASPNGTTSSSSRAAAGSVARKLAMTPEAQQGGKSATGRRAAPGSARAGGPAPRPAALQVDVVVEPQEEEVVEGGEPPGSPSLARVGSEAAGLGSPEQEKGVVDKAAEEAATAAASPDAQGVASPSSAAASPDPAAASPAVGGSPEEQQRAGGVPPPSGAADSHTRTVSSASLGAGGGIHSRNQSTASCMSDSGKSHRRTPSGTVLMMSTHSRNASLTKADTSPAQEAPAAPPPRYERGTITFVDLAGSERAWDSMYHDAEQRKQTAEINASLSCLKECFRVRSLQMQKAIQKGGTSPQVLRVPYRDSRLTLLLRDSLQSTSSTEPGVVVVATLSPCAADTEHTLNTLRNAITMTGLDVNHANKGESAREEDIAVDDGGSKIVKHPSRWTSEELREWMATVCDGKYAAASENLTSTTDGKAVTRFAPVRFKLLCNGNARQGDDLYRLLKAEVKKANESKSQHQETVRNIGSVKTMF